MKFYYILILSSILFSFSGCNNHKTVSISFKPDTVSVLRNPAMGWVMYEEGWSFNGGKNNPYTPEIFWEEMDAVNASAYSNILYIRVLWNVMEPEEGRYAWIYNEAYKNYIRKAKDRGLKLAFRIFFDNGVPDFVYKAGCKSTLDPPMSLENDKQPYYDDPVFLEKLTNFIRAFAKEYDNPDIVDFVDAYGLGRWGEGHGVTLKDERNREYVMRRVTEEYANNFKRILTVMNLSFADYKYSKPLVYDKLGFLSRRDGIGSFWFDDEERKMLNELFPDKAFIGEGCYWFNSPTDTTNYHDYFKEEKRFNINNFSEALTVGVEDALVSHSNTYDLRVPAQCKFWIEKLPDPVQKFITLGGYRLYPLTIKIQQDKNSLKIEHVWTNFGVGVLPNRHPNWNHKYQVSFSLLDPLTKEVKFVYTDVNVEPSDWLKGKNYSYTSSFRVPDELSSGNYYLCVGITDSTKKNQPGIILSLPSDNILNGWASITSVQL